MRDSEREREREHGFADCSEVQSLANMFGRDPVIPVEGFIH